MQFNVGCVSIYFLVVCLSLFVATTSTRPKPLACVYIILLDCMRGGFNSWVCVLYFYSGFISLTCGQNLSNGLREERNVFLVSYSSHLTLPLLNDCLQIPCACMIFSSVGSFDAHELSLFFCPRFLSDDQALCFPFVATSPSRRPHFLVSQLILHPR